MSSCASTSVVSDIVVVTPPSELTEHCEAPVALSDTVTWRELSSYLLEYKFALKSCNEDKSALRNWIASNKKIKLLSTIQIGSMV